jgi:hypothetical protein
MVINRKKLINLVQIAHLMIKKIGLKEFLKTSKIVLLAEIPLIRVQNRYIDYKW